MRPGIILQARLASTRLPWKAVRTVGGLMILEHCIERLRQSGLPVVLATTTSEEDAVLAGIAERAGSGVFRGDSQDVLQRFVAAATCFGFDPVIRATADNPAVDIEASGRVIGAFTDGIDYVREQGLPLGTCVEGVRFEALRQSAIEVTDAYDREHVTTFIRSHPERFATRTLIAPPHLCRPDLSLTIDTPDDLEYVRSLFALAGRVQPSLSDLLAVVPPLAA